MGRTTWVNYSYLGGKSTLSESIIKRHWCTAIASHRLLRRWVTELDSFEYGQLPLPDLDRPTSKVTSDNVDSVLLRQQVTQAYRRLLPRCGNASVAYSHIAKVMVSTWYWWTRDSIEHFPQKGISDFLEESREDVLAYTWLQRRLLWHPLDPDNSRIC